MDLNPAYRLEEASTSCAGTTYQQPDTDSSTEDATSSSSSNHHSNITSLPPVYHRTRRRTCDSMAPELYGTLRLSRILLFAVIMLQLLQHAKSQEDRTSRDGVNRVSNTNLHPLDLHQFTREELRQTFGVTSRNKVPHHHTLYPQHTHTTTSTSQRPQLKTLTVELPQDESDQNGRFHQESQPRLTIQLRPNDRELFHDNLISIHRDLNGTHKMKVGHLPESCHYEGIHNNTVAAISDCDGGLRGVIIHEGELYVLHPVPSRHDETYYGNETIGRVKRSVDPSNIGLHVIYKREVEPSAVEDDAGEKKGFCGSDVETMTDVGMGIMDAGIGDTVEDLAVIANRLTADSDLVVELAIFVDQRLWDKFSTDHGYQAESKLNNYISTVINSIQIIYKQPTMMPQLKFRITRIEILKSQPWQLADNQHSTGNAQDYLAAFCKYQNSLVSGKNWDHAFLLSGYDLHRGFGQTTISGIARLNGMCDGWNTCTVTEGFDFTSVFIGAHELGHSLGMSHDEPYCSSKYIMSASLGAGKTTWSSCSMRDFHKQMTWLDSRGRNCLRDSIQPEVLNTNLNQMPGQLYSADTQCEMMHGAGYKKVTPRNDHYDTLCYMMWCGTSAWGRIISSHPALEGTTCRDGQWCVEGRCVSYSHSSGVTPDPRLTTRVDGSWSAWSTAQCNRCECGRLQGSIGILRSTRTCDNPAPRNGGRSCGDDKTMGVICSRSCESTSTESIQDYMDGICNNHRTLRRDFELTGEATRFLTQQNRACKVFCKQVATSSTSVSYRYYGDLLPDGTSCTKPSGDAEESYCVDGECLPVSCSSKAVSTREQGCPTATCSFSNPITITVAPQWSSWSTWSYCSVTCGSGRKRRARRCTMAGACDGDNEESTTCDEASCTSAKTVEWSNWYAWTSCSVTCGAGTRVRERRCINGSWCPGSTEERENCDEGWCPWGSWSQCSRSCGAGSKRRSRTCPNSASCLGSYYDDQTCNDQSCSRETSGSVNWSSWGSWSACSISCGGKGLRQRTRICTGSGCSGDKTEQENESCGESYCPWSAWSSCSITCGASGTKLRTRECPYGSCVDSDNAGNGLKQTENCYEGDCSNSRWLNWGDWTTCSTTCGIGVRARYRRCDRRSGGDDCQGESSERDDCETGVSCGSWQEWQSWSPCSVTCLQGTMTRKRSCNGDFSQCVGISTQLMTCHRGSCLTKGQWSTWSDWNDCSRTCGGGIKSRQRTCSEVKGSCDGNSLESVPCNTFDCNSAIDWLNWGPWSVCSRTCGEGQRQRFRTCRPAGSCSQDRDLESCAQGVCAGDGIWGTWSEWSSCSQACGPGVQKRRRSCNTGVCPGESADQKECHLRPCAEWGGWGHWSSCSKTCNHGTKRRIRNCYGWGDCDGSGEETQNCFWQYCS